MILISLSFPEISLENLDIICLLLETVIRVRGTNSTDIISLQIIITLNLYLRLHICGNTRRLILEKFESFIVPWKTLWSLY